MDELKRPGMGDIKKEELENLLDKYQRQTRLGPEAEREFPNISKAFGNESLRSTPEQYYNEYGKQLNWPKEIKGDEREISRSLRDVENQAEDNIADIYDKDILKTQYNLHPDTEHGLKQQEIRQFFTSLKNKLGLKTEGTWDNIEPQTGVYYPKTDNITLSTWDDKKGTAMHELGHADLKGHGSGSESLSLGRMLQPHAIKVADNIVDNGGRIDKILRSIAGIDTIVTPRYIQEKGLSTFSPEYPDVESVAQDLAKKKALRSLFEGTTKGHFGKDMLNYPIDKTYQDYSTELQKRGFEREVPEESPKFEQLKYLFPKK